MKQKETLIICLHSTYIKDINFTTQLSIYLHNYLQFTVKYTILQYVKKKTLYKWKHKNKNLSHVHKMFIRNISQTQHKHVYF